MSTACFALLALQPWAAHPRCQEMHTGLSASCWMSLPTCDTHTACSRKAELHCTAAGDHHSNASQMAMPELRIQCTHHILRQGSEWMQPTDNNHQVYLLCSISVLSSVHWYQFDETLVYNNQNVVSWLRAHVAAPWSWLNKSGAPLVDGCIISISYFSIHTY